MSTAASPAPLALSVIVPTFNRRSALLNLVDRLASQTLDRDRYEVIVVVDGSTDGSADALADWAKQHPAVRLRVIHQTNAGQSAARTRGADQAAAPLLLFLDDDVLPGDGCLAAHLRAHESAGRATVVLGDAWVPEAERESYYDIVTRMWWADYYAQRAARAPHLLYKDFCSNHVSLPREVFFAVGGFDPTFQGYGGEDYELGYRLLQAGYPFALCPQAEARHHHRGSPRQVVRNLRSEGRQDVLLTTRHPELRRTSRLSRRGAAERLLLRFPGCFAAALPVASTVLGLLESLRLWSAWRWLLGKTRFVAYWIGVRSAFRSTGAYRDFVAASPPPPEFHLDITHGLPPDLPHVLVRGACTLIVHADGRGTTAVDVTDQFEGSLADHLAECILR